MLYIAHNTNGRFTFTNFNCCYSYYDCRSSWVRDINIWASDENILNVSPLRTHTPNSLTVYIGGVDDLDSVGNEFWDAIGVSRPDEITTLWGVTQLVWNGIEDMDDANEVERLVLDALN